MNIWKTYLKQENNEHLEDLYKMKTMNIWRTDIKQENNEHLEDLYKMKTMTLGGPVSVPLKPSPLVETLPTCGNPPHLWIPSLQKQHSQQQSKGTNIKILVLKELCACVCVGSV